MEQTKQIQSPSTRTSSKQPGKPLKTFKRETAGVAGAGLIVLAGSAVGLASDHAIEVLKIITWPVMLFIGSAFGMDFVKKQTNWGGAPSEFEDDHIDYGDIE